MELTTKSDLIKEIRRQHRAIIKGKQQSYNFLGFVESRNLTQEVEDYFSFKNDNGVVLGYEWTRGNKYLKELIKETTKDENH